MAPYSYAHLQLSFPSLATNSAGSYTAGQLLKSLMQGVLQSGGRASAEFELLHASNEIIEGD